MRRLIITFYAIVLSVSLFARNVSVSVSNAAATEVFAEIMRQTGLNFIYPAGLLDGISVSVDVSNVPVNRVLEIMFKETGIDYRVKDRNVMLMRRSTVAPHNMKYVTVSGFVREAGSQEALAGATVADVNSRASVSANANGFYSLSVPSGTVALTVSYPGCDTNVTLPMHIEADRQIDFALKPAHQLREVEVVGSRNNSMTMESADLGHYQLSSSTIQAVPGMLGESDMVKSLHMQPGVSSGMEGVAGMYVHGGNADENMYMIDNIPLYQVNHIAGLFSAFNTEAIRNVDFYKSSFPAKYDGRLSSFIDVHTRDGSRDGHRGSLNLGLSSASLEIDGPIKRGRTSYMLAVRRTWQELLAWPLLALSNADSDEKTDFGYMFMDINAKVNHHFSDRSRVYVMFYYGHDKLHGGSEESFTGDVQKWEDSDNTRLRWGNTVLSAGWNYVLSPKIFGEFTVAYSRYGSYMSNEWSYRQTENDKATETTHSVIESDNNITDWIFRADFDWHPAVSHRMTFGASYTRHSFLPSRSTRTLTTGDFRSEAVDSAWTYRANELNAYVGDDWSVSDRLRVNAGVHFSLFGIDGRLRHGLSPRLSARYSLSPCWAVKASYSRAVQYVHQLTQSYVSLPSDQWVPITGSFRPQSSDKFSVGFYRVSSDGRWSLSAEGYCKWLHNIVDYVDEYYLVPPQSVWNSRLTSGRGSAKGLDFKLAKDAGALTGHVAYSLLWADRTFAGKNGGNKYPARFDNRHKINLFLNWQASAKWEINVAWTGMTGNRITLPTQMWVAPDFDGTGGYEVPLRTDVNNYRLPFYHRLDLGFKRNTRHGFWNFSVYNAYCHMNVVAVRRGNAYPGSVPVFQQVHYIPIIPSISYTWIF